MQVRECTIILVHGAWQGRWCWARLMPLVQRAGFEVVTVELTGCGSRSAELTSEVELSTHVVDVVAAVEGLGDRAAVLAAHSYAGMVAAGALELVHERVAAVVLVDAFYPSNGESALDLMPSSFQHRFRQQAAEVGDGWRLPAQESLLDAWGLHDPGDRRWVWENLTDWSLRCFESAVVAPKARLRHCPRWYVGGVGDHAAGQIFAAMGQRAEDDGARYLGLECGHDVQVERPADLAAIVLDAAETVRAL